MNSCRVTLKLALFFACLPLAGCGSGHNKEIFGTVTVNELPVEVGTVRFVPIEGTPGAVGYSKIVDGQYRITARGGIAPGRYRVEVKAERKTGKRVMLPSISDEEIEVDETELIAPREYAGKKSPLIVEISADSDGQHDLTLPSK